MSINLGQRFETKEAINQDSPNNLKNRIRRWVVTEIYPFFIKARSHVGDGLFETRCFNLGELVQLGLEPKGAMDE